MWPWQMTERLSLSCWKWSTLPLRCCASWHSSKTRRLGTVPLVLSSLQRNCCALLTSSSNRRFTPLQSSMDTSKLHSDHPIVVRGHPQMTLSVIIRWHKMTGGGRRFDFSFSTALLFCKHPIFHRFYVSIIWRKVMILLVMIVLEWTLSKAELMPHCLLLGYKRKDVGWSCMKIICCSALFVSYRF